MATDFWSPVKLSIEIASVSGILVVVFGLIFGKVMANKKFKGIALIETIFLLPLVLPPSVVGFLLIVIFGRNSPIGQCSKNCLDNLLCLLVGSRYCFFCCSFPSYVSISKDRI